MNEKARNVMRIMNLPLRRRVERSEMSQSSLYKTRKKNKKFLNQKSKHLKGILFL